MRRPLVAVAGSLAVLLAVATAAVAVVTIGQRDGGSGYGMHQMMNGESRWGDQDRPAGPRHWMHGAAVTTEYGYLTEMIAHHEEAVAAATELATLRPAADARLRTVDRGASQSAQIKQMKTWLADGAPADPPTSTTSP